MRVWVICRILWIFTGNAMGLLFQDPVVCRLNRNTQCHVALGRRLHLQMVMEHFFYLIQRGESSNEHFILEYTHSLDPPKPTSPRWQFVNDNKTMILSRAERSDSGKYTLVIIDQDKNVKTHYSLQLNVEAEVSSVKVWSTCLSAGIQTMHCSADGDNLLFSWTDLNPVFQLEDGNSTAQLKNQGTITCHVENNVSSAQKSTEFHQCLVTSVIQPDPGFKVFVTLWLFEVIILLSLLVGTFYIYTRIYRTQTESDREDQDAL